MREIHDLAEFDRHVVDRGALDDVVVQGVDLSDRADLVASLSTSGSAFLGCRLRADVVESVIDGGAVVFPRVPGIPVDPYRARLYRQGELLDGWTPGAGNFDTDALDSRIYHWSRRDRRANPTVLDALAQRLHDHAIDEALADHVAAHPDIVAVMGGHSLTRADADYHRIVELGRSMAANGWHVATGGGPGAMEAANLGAWLSTYPPDAIDAAVERLAGAPDFHHPEPYLTAGVAVLDEFADGAESLAVPTWFYGHEPTNQFATHIAKYFANSIREDGLLAIATRGVVFAPGAAGTVQEIFQDATQNHYAVFDVISPMVLLGRTFWSQQLPAAPLLESLAGDRDYADLIAVVDDVAEAVEFLRSNPPRRTATA